MRPRDGEGRLAMKLQLSVDIVVCFLAPKRRGLNQTRPQNTEVPNNAKNHAKKFTQTHYCLDKTTYMYTHTHTQ